MSQSARQQNLYGVQNWQSVYQTIQPADFVSYDYETLRKSMIDYMQAYHPENFNDYINSSEFIALIDVIAFMGQSLSFRYDLAARESFLETAQSTTSINNLAELLSYAPRRNLTATGFLKINSIATNGTVFDSLGNNLSNQVIYWNDRTNGSWQDQWNSILNAALVSSQTIGQPANTNSINNIPTSEYSISLAPSVTPPVPFTAVIGSTRTNFEFVNPTSVGETYVYEQSPNNNKTFTLLYQNDNLGFSSPNTGFFLQFKQGNLTSTAFTFNESLPNQTYALGSTGINNTDVWLFQINNDGSLTQWSLVDSVTGQNAIYNNQSSDVRNIFSISTGVNDTITLVFGDGTFGNIPVGNFVCYARVSNGLAYRINPNELSNIQIVLPYSSKNNQTQNLTITASLLYTVANSAAAETSASVAVRAPQQYYTQNRMVNGQDYNSFPFTQFSNIVKIQATNRVSSGFSRYLDTIDPTGRYSNTNIFCDDGFVYQNSAIVQVNNTYGSINELSTAIEQLIYSLQNNAGLLSFFYDNYPGLVVSNVGWTMTTSGKSSSNGYLTNLVTNALLNTADPIFTPTPTQNSLFINGAILQFTAPTGYVFDINNKLVPGQPNGALLANQSTTIYASVKGIVLNGVGNYVGATGINVNGTGAITLSQVVPSGAILSQILPVFDTVVPNTLIQNCITNIQNNQASAFSYNSNNINNIQSDTWILSGLPFNFSPSIYGTAFATPSAMPDSPLANWLLAIVPGTQPNTYTVYQRNIEYVFGSAGETTFYFDPNAQIYNASSSTQLIDTISVLKTNALPGTATNTGYSSDISMYVNNVVFGYNGLLDTGKVQVQWTDTQSVGVPDNPYFFRNIVGSSLPNYVFLINDNIAATSSILPSGTVVIVSTVSIIDNNLYNYASGTIFFTLDTHLFYQVIIINNIATRNTLNNPTSQYTYQFFTGRQDLKFQYQHYAAANRRIDPTPSNIIDLYILEQSYATAYQNWVTDVTGQVAIPTPPTSDSLANDFAILNNYKMYSDQIIFNPVTFKPLFGASADPNLQAQFIVVPQPNLIIGVGEIASRVITQINNFFAIANWEFGETFYVSELTAYIHSQLSSIISSINLVPTGAGQVYGNLQQIYCLPSEIFTSSAAVTDILVVNDLTTVNLRIGQ